MVTVLIAKEDGKMMMEDFEKQFEGSGFSEPQKTYVMAEAWLKYLQECERDIDNKIVAENEFFYPEDICGHKKGDRITDGFDVCFLSKSSDWERYALLVDVERRQMGFNFKHDESMTWDAERLYNRAANNLVDWGFKMLREYSGECPSEGIDYIKQNITARDRFCNIAMKLRGVA